MKFKKILILIFFICISLSLISCGKKTQHYDIDKYILEIPYKENFKVLQLTDIHLGNKDNQKLHLDFMDLTIKDANADFIVVTGDLFTFADKVTAKRLFKFLDSYEIPWTVTFGNHDEQCYFSIDWLTKYLSNYGSNCKFIDLQDDDVHGNANFAINLVDGSTIKEQVIIMDSNRYNYGEYIGYDYIKQDQIDWYESLINYTTEKNGGVKVPSMIACHIPVPEFDEAWNLAENDELTVLEGDKREKCCCPDPEYDLGFFDKVVELGSTNLILVGHDHINDYCIQYKGVYLSYGVKSTNRIYYEEGLLGGQTITIKPDQTLEFNRILHNYEEVK